MDFTQKNNTYSPDKYDKCICRIRNKLEIKEWKSLHHDKILQLLYVKSII